jgi:hypothetical protein
MLGDTLRTEVRAQFYYVPKLKIRRFVRLQSEVGISLRMSLISKAAQGAGPCEFKTSMTEAS